MIMASLFFALMGATVKELTSRLPSTEVVFFRFAINALLVVPFLVKKKVTFLGKNHKLLFVRNFFGFMAGLLSFYVTSQIKLADAYLLYQTSTLFVAALAVFYLSEVISVPLVAAIVTALFGSILIIKPSFEVINIPGVLGLASAFFSAIAYIAIKKLHSTDHYLTIVFQYSLFSAIGALIFSKGFLLPIGFEWWLLIACGVFGTIAQVFLTYSYKSAEASIVSPYSYSTVLFSFIFGLIFWNEIPDIWSFAGGGLIVMSGLFIIKIRDKNKIILVKEA